MSQMARECEICGAALATEGGYVVHQLRVHEQPHDDPVAAEETASVPPVPPRRVPAASAFVAIGIAVAMVMAGGVATALVRTRHHAPSALSAGPVGQPTPSTSRSTTGTSPTTTRPAPATSATTAS